MKIFFSVGEPSGDLHGANLIHEIKEQAPLAVFVGYGGPKMKAAGCELHEDLTRLAVMWFLRVLLNIRTFWQLLWRADRYFQDHRPDAVVLIDYPGFNWWIARRAKAHGISVFYYGTPQMWAWAPWRVKKMRRLVDHILCKLPFEVDWYGQRGCNATFVGHPYFDELASRKLDQSFVDQMRDDQMPDDQRPLITILPGSRTQEVQLNLASFIETAKLIRIERPDVRFAVASFKQSQAEMATKLLEQELPDVRAFLDKTPELIEASTCCLACSGSVSLELLYHGKPSVIHYRVSRFAFFVQRFFRKVRFITLANLIATEDRYCQNGEIYDHKTDQHKVPFPEYLTCTNRSPEMAGHILDWLRDPAASQRTREQLAFLKQQYASRGASRAAAEYIVARLESSAPDGDVQTRAA